MQVIKTLPWITKVLNHTWTYELVTIIPQYEYTQMLMPAFTYAGMEYVVFVGTHHRTHDYVCARIQRVNIDRNVFAWDQGHYNTDYVTTLLKAVELSRLQRL